MKPTHVRLTKCQPGWPTGTVHEVVEWWDFGAAADRPAIAPHPASSSRFPLRLLLHEYEPVDPPVPSETVSVDLPRWIVEGWAIDPAVNQWLAVACRSALEAQ